MTLGFTTRTTGDVVPAGLYWNVKEWQAQVVPAPGAALKGEPRARFVRLPLLALLVLAPVMGGIYAFFLPFIGFALVIAYLVRRIGGGLRGQPILSRPFGLLRHGARSGSARSDCAHGASS